MDIFNPSLDINPSHWPLWCACLLLLIAAVVNARTLRVSNWLSLPAIVGGWLVALAIGASVEGPYHGGGLIPSLAGTAVGLVFLLPFYQSDWLGAGCVKMQMAFGAWVGCAVDWPTAVLITGLGAAAGELLTLIGAGLAVWRLRAREGAGASSNWLFPAQVTLSLGSVCGVVAAGLLGWV